MPRIKRPNEIKYWSEPLDAVKAEVKMLTRYLLIVKPWLPPEVAQLMRPTLVLHSETR